MSMHTAHRWFGFLLVIAITHTAAAAERKQPDLNQAQSLVFMGDHLQNVKPGQTLTYAYTSRSQGQAAVTDSVKMKATAIAENGGRDLEFEFLSGERRIPFPSVTGYKGNPVILQFLERDVRDMAEASGGSGTYFRNRVRNAFAEPGIEEIQIEYAGTKMKATQITVKPFTDDMRANAELAPYRHKTYKFVFAEDLPGGLYVIRTNTPETDGEGRVQLEEELKFGSAEVLPAAALTNK